MERYRFHELTVFAYLLLVTAAHLQCVLTYRSYRFVRVTILFRESEHMINTWLYTSDVGPHIYVHNTYNTHTSV